MKWPVTCVFLSLAACGFAQERPKITGVSHLSVYASDAAKTEQFYEHGLGALKAPDPQSAQGVRYYFNPVQFVEVLPLPVGPPTVGRFDHAGLNVTNAEAMRVYLKAHKIDVPAAVTKASDGSQFFEVLDPEGNRIQFVQPPVKPLVVPANPLSKHIIHIGILVHSAEVENAFYRDLLGFRPYWHGGGAKDAAPAWISQQVPDGTDWIEYMMVKGPEKTGIPPTMTQDSVGVLDHFALGVQNMEQAVTMLTAGDRISEKHSPMQLGRDGKWQFNLYDPDGTRAELMEFQPSVKPCCSPFLLPSPTQ
jgi:catechol 2,3-dioxygenase-like lactoylglutathione lyase family enzyme